MSRGKPEFGHPFTGPASIACKPEERGKLPERQRQEASAYRAAPFAASTRKAARVRKRFFKFLMRA